MSIDLADLQGDILRAYGNAYAHTAYLFFRVDDAGAGRAWLRALLPRVTTAEPWGSGKPTTTLNLSVTADGLRALGVPDAVLATFSHEFRAGMPARAETLGDAGPSDPATWEPELRGAGLHVLATVNALDDGALAHEITRLHSDAASAAASPWPTSSAPSCSPARASTSATPTASPSRRSPGAATTRATGASAAASPRPRARGVRSPQASSSSATRTRTRASIRSARCRARRPTPSDARAPTWCGASSTRTWRSSATCCARPPRSTTEATTRSLAAKVVGRWPNGTPLVLSPDAPIADFDAKTATANAFRYAGEDPDGRRCPLGAHIRRTNPRDALGFDGLLSFRHRIIRRGMPYGPPLAAEAAEDDHVDRGLIFVCFNASISRQFEGIQAQWINDGNVFGLGHDSDFLMGDPNGTGKMTVEGDPPFFLGPQGPFVTTRGGAYLFVPGMAALAALAAPAG